ncbi:MAG TPA: S1 family peptidase [Kofleriaceae bacterium]|nr:S1 family peptidase [Kofleriaceae bacterium]
MRWAAGIAALALAGCAVPELSTAESEIRGGSVDDGDPAVAALNILGLYAYCTATLISNHTVLTAGHCNFDAIEADFGTQSDAPAQSIDIVAVKVHPMYTDEGKPYDLALMKLAKDPVGITPVALNDAPIADGAVGQTLRHVGFGVTDDGTGDGGGTKRTVSYPLNRIDAILMYSGATGKQTCTGDSGGPALMMNDQGSELLVGVVSDGPDCQLSMDGWDDRVDLVKDWIVQTVSAWDAPPSFGEVEGGAPPGGGSDGTGGSGSMGSGGQDGGAGPGGSGGCAAVPGGGGGLWLLGLVAWLALRSRATATRSGRSRRARRSA